MLSPNTLRNSANAGVSSLFPNNSSSDVWRRKKNYETFPIINLNASEYNVCLTHLAKLLIDDPELEGVIDFMLVKADYQLRGLRDEKKQTATERQSQQEEHMCVTGLFIIQEGIRAGRSCETKWGPEMSWAMLKHWSIHTHTEWACGH